MQRELAGQILSYGVNAQGHRTGAEIKGGDGDLLPGRPSDAVGLDPEIAFAFMGRNGGTQGPALTEDLATGQWRDRQYELRVDDARNDNWFSIADFLEKINNAGP
jgi:hypothetical protein